MDDFQKLAQVLEKYGSEVNDVLEDVIAEVAKEAAKEVAAASPKKSGKYSKGWKTENTGTRLVPGRTVYNIRPGLPHLLEYGHALKGGGRTKAQPHIAPVNDRIIDKIEEKLGKALG